MTFPLTFLICLLIFGIGAYVGWYWHEAKVHVDAMNERITDDLRREGKL